MLLLHTCAPMCMYMYMYMRECLSVCAVRGRGKRKDKETEIGVGRQTADRQWRECWSRSTGIMHKVFCMEGKVYAKKQGCKLIYDQALLHKNTIDTRRINAKTIHIHHTYSVTVLLCSRLQYKLTHCKCLGYFRLQQNNCMSSSFPLTSYLDWRWRQFNLKSFSFSSSAFPAISLGFTIHGKICAYVTGF